MSGVVGFFFVARSIPQYVGIDLGTTNSAAATFDGTRVDLVRNAQGSTLTPTVVRIDARQNVTVGARARRMMDQDPENCRGEFKRLMGTTHALRFPASGLEKSPEQLSARVLQVLREDIRAQSGVLPARAVIGVPALFELPQIAATGEAARLAGFDRVEIIQEPVASAIAAGWKAEERQGAWLVFDFGGGTFDVSLLETQDGMLRVVGHDGDNFLGGRDFDALIVDWAIGKIAVEYGVHIARTDATHANALRRLRLAAEDAKIELSTAREAEILLSGLEVGSRSIDMALIMDRETLERLVEPLIMRSVSVSCRLLTANGIALREGGLSRIVLVGGPTAMPLLRARVAEMLDAPFSEGLDPMTLVAQGSALYAASLGLDSRAPSPAPAPGPNTVKVWLNYPAMSSDPSPYVVGKLVDAADRARVVKVVVRRADGVWSSDPEPLDAEGTFAVMLHLATRVPNQFEIEGRDERDGPVALTPSTFGIVHGVTIGDPPLSRSVGVALSNDAVRIFFERGSPLPMRRTFGMRTVEALSAGDPDGGISVPIVQGEFPLAHLCRLVGSLEIRARDLNASLPARALVEVTLELDRGGRLSASARVHQTSQVFDEVAHVVASGTPVSELGPRLSDLSQRVQATRARAFRQATPGVIQQLSSADGLVADAMRDAEAARGGDIDAAEKARRLLLDLDIALADAEAAFAWPDLERRVSDKMTRATEWMAAFGTPEERRILANAFAAVDKARIAKSPQELNRQVNIISRLGESAYLRSPGAWERELDFSAGRVAEASDPRRAARLVEDGRAAAARRDDSELQRAVCELWELLPYSAADRVLGYGSGVR